jgi:hypothetical protein
LLYNFTVMSGSSDVVPSDKYGTDLVPVPSDMRSTVVVPSEKYDDVYDDDVYDDDVYDDDDFFDDVGDDFFFAEACAHPDAASAHVSPHVSPHVSAHVSAHVSPHASPHVSTIWILLEAKLHIFAH